ncbi:hypothetical protein EMIHUDRAFT_208166 [Emiliania huxleyi CCMP1516]|uniref:PPM-type phosphatase domain-containing protein n=2 Tax=Emiliania huxleyi TaxID=2903 RepID=A0A0D3JC10_EMIH1|nr:hypothetical protein EMIHUDRAFT_208166 [Emiliania huxleyi CCMP1516]EOD21045.1 hypothetical protein EMIHUDRAFT_208166 [Emiliania huxleyi CCMP1516]|eukprot:XP_005773474.1 hypothetical protein EMIHUDRAFT_208166 [Emiliania huxleyi CCMP1516]
MAWAERRTSTEHTASPSARMAAPNSDRLRQHKIRWVAVVTDGVGDGARFDGPRGIAISPDGSVLLVADMFNHKMRRAEVATGAVTTLAGSGEKGEAHGVGDAVQFHFPHSLAISPDGSAPLSVTESINDKIRRVEVATGAVTTLAGCGACGSVDGLLQAAQTTSQRHTWPTKSWLSRLPVRARFNGVTGCARAAGKYGT